MSLKTLFASLALAALAAAPALAQQPGGGLAEICKSELAGVCGTAPADGKGSPVRCLFENEAKLGAECAAAVKVVKERREKLRAACKEDADKFCQAEAGRGGGFVQCLRSKQAELSKGCADAIAALPATGKP